MAAAHKRVIAGMGVDVFKEQVLDKFGLVLDDDTVVGVAEALGWNTSWISARQGRHREAVPSQDLVNLLNSQPRLRTSSPGHLAVPLTRLGECISSISQGCDDDDNDDDDDDDDDEGDDDDDDGGGGGEDEDEDDDDDDGDDGDE